MDHFLDKHPEIAEQLRRDPSLIDNREWVARHPELQEYLNSHQRLAQVFASIRTPSCGMRTAMTKPVIVITPECRPTVPRDRDERNRGELTSFGHFLGGHPNMATELSADPTLASNKEYLANPS